MASNSLNVPGRDARKRKATNGHLTALALPIFARARQRVAGIKPSSAPRQEGGRPARASIAGKFVRDRATASRAAQPPPAASKPSPRRIRAGKPPLGWQWASMAAPEHKKGPAARPRDPGLLVCFRRGRHPPLGGVAHASQNFVNVVPAGDHACRLRTPTSPSPRDLIAATAAMLPAAVVK